MADRRTDDSPLAPRRSLSAPSRSEGQEGDGKRPLTERVSTALATASNAVVEAAAPAKGTASNNRTSAPPKRESSAPPAKAKPRATRKARLRLTHLDPWSVMKTSFLLSIAFGIVTVIAVAVVWSVLGAAGVWESINRTVTDLLGNNQSGFDIRDYIGTSRVVGFAMIVAVVDVVLITAISTLCAFLYNLAAALLGGLEVTLAEDDR
ncbi:MAG TPA: DUF3566 domain-containing protein [Nocardioidaceae bacterium]|jgi:hypothetical protein|nr:DUF3566 domain-containing protein [Nocardioidaceae bacterium]